MRDLKKFRKVKSFKLGTEEPSPVILHVSTPGSWRGGEQQLYYLYEELDAQNIEQYLICNSIGQLYKRTFANRWNIIPFKIRTGLDIGFAYEIKHLCKTLNVTAVHTHDSRAHTFAILARVLFRNKTPLVVSRRVDFTIGKSAFSKFKYNHPAIAKIICVSDAIKEVMRPSIKDETKLCTIHSGIDFKKFNVATSNYLKSTFNVPKGYKIVANISAIAPHKDYFTFVNTAKMLIESGVKAKFFIIGDGKEKRKVEEYVAQLNLLDEIYFTGFVKHIIPIMKSIDVLLITSKTEGLGTTILDAFACKIPVVATRAGGIPEIVQDGVTGLTAEVEDVKQLAKHVTTILNDGELRMELTQKALTVLQDFSRENTAKKTLEIYKSLL